MLESSEIIHRLLPKVVTENLFVQISEQMEWLDADISALQPTLEQAPEVLKPVSVNLSINVSLCMINHFVFIALMLQSHIGHESVSVDGASFHYVFSDMSLEWLLATAPSDSSANISTTLKDADNCNLVFGSSLTNSAAMLVSVHEASSATDKGFVYFDFAPASTDLSTGTALHYKPQTVKHEPCAFLSNTDSATNFVRTDAVFAVGEHPHCDKPFLQRDRRILKYSPDLDTELLARMFIFAFPYPSGRDVANILTGTGWANDTVRPPTRNQKLLTDFGIGEVDYRLLECLWLSHGVPHRPKSIKTGLLSQVYYCPYEKIGGG